MARPARGRAKACGKPVAAWHIALAMIRQASSFMTVFSTVRFSARDWRGHMIPILLAGGATAGAVALVAYLLWPTWSANGLSTPERLPISVGGAVFNVPAAAIRLNVQR